MLTHTQASRRLTALLTGETSGAVPPNSAAQSVRPNSGIKRMYLDMALTCYFNRSGRRVSFCCCREGNIAAVQQRRASTGAGDETQAAGLPMLDSDQPTQAGHAEQQEAASEISPRYAGAALSRLPRAAQRNLPSSCQ